APTTEGTQRSGYHRPNAVPRAVRQGGRRRVRERRQAGGLRREQLRHRSGGRIMATGPRYNVPMRRRREVRTDYHQRLRLLKSGKPRLVARKSNRHVRAQLVTPSPDGDETHASASSADLEEYGWEAPTGNLPS